MNKPKPPADFDENPEWTEADFARARPASEMHPPEVVEALVRKRGRPAGTLRSDRTQIALRLPNAVLEHFKKGGAGWQTRIVEVLEREAAKG